MLAGHVVDMHPHHRLLSPLRALGNARPVLRSILGNAGWLLVDRAFRMVVGLLVGVWVARYLGPEQFGQLSWAIALATLFSALANVGVDSLVVRELVRRRTEESTLLGTAFALKFVGALLALGGAGTLVTLLRPEDRLSAVLVLLTSTGFLFQTLDPIDLWFQARALNRPAALARVFAYGLGAAIKVGLILLHAPLVAFAVVGTAEIGIAASALWVAYRQFDRHPGHWRFDRGVMRSLMREGAPLLASGLLVTAYMRADQVLLGELLGNREAGIYSAATRISELLFVLPMVAMAAIGPHLVRVREAGREALLGALQRVFNVMTLLALAASLVTSLGSWHLTMLLFGPQYAASAAVMAVHVWALPFVALGVASSQYLVLEGLSALSLQRTAVGCAVNLGLNAVLIPRYGPIGAAWATVISYAAAVFWLLHAPSSRACGTMLLKAFAPWVWVRRL